MAFLAFEPLKIVATTVRSVPFPLRILFSSYFDIAWLFALILFSVYFLLCRISISVLVSRTFCIWLVSTNWIFFLFCAPCIFSTNSNRHEHKLHFSQQILNGCLFRSLLAADLLRAPTLANILLLCVSWSCIAPSFMLCRIVFIPLASLIYWHQTQYWLIDCIYACSNNLSQCFIRRIEHWTAHIPIFIYTDCAFFSQ